MVEEIALRDGLVEPASVVESKEERDALFAVVRVELGWDHLCTARFQKEDGAQITWTFHPDAKWNDLGDVVPVELGNQRVHGDWVVYWTNDVVPAPVLEKVVRETLIVASLPLELFIVSN